MRGALATKQSNAGLLHFAGNEWGWRKNKGVSLFLETGGAAAIMGSHNAGNAADGGLCAPPHFLTQDNFVAEYVFK